MKFIIFIGGAKRDRTADPLRARQVLSQLSYGPNFYKWSGRQDLNLRPPGPKPGALPSCATSRKNGALGRNRTHNLLIRSQALYPVELLAHINGAQGRSRTGTDFKVRRILSPVRLPISPPGLIQLNGDPQATRTPDPLIKSQMLYQLS